MPMRFPSLMILVGACGGGSSSGAPPDVNVDAAVDGASSQPVTLTVTEGGAPRVGVHVYFVATDSTPVATVDTDAGGMASAMLPAGGSVTLLDPFPDTVEELAPTVGQNQLVSYLGVQPGDHLTLLRSDRLAVSFTLVAPAVTGATNYDVITTCGNDSLRPDAAGGATASGTVMLKGCHGATDVAIVARSVDPVSHASTPLSGLFHAGAVADGTAVTLSDPYAALVTRSFTYLNPPAGATLDVAHSPLAAHGPIGPFKPTLTGNSGTIHEPVTTASSAVTVSYDRSTVHYSVMEWGALAVDYQLDLAGALPRDIVDPPTYDVAGGRATWGEAAQGATPDASVMLVGAARPAQSRKWTWTVIAPYTRGEIRLPRLPTDVADWIPVAGDTARVDQVTNLKLTGGYDALRTAKIDFGRDDRSLISGAQGTIAAVNAEGARVTVAPAAAAVRSARRSIFGSRR